MNSRALALAPLALGALGTAALAGVDVEITGKSAVRSSIDREGEREVYRFFAPKGSVLTFSAKAKKNGLSDLDVELQDTGENEFDLDGEAGFSDTGTSVKGKKIVLDESGTWTLVVTGTGTGEYAIKASLKPEKSVKATKAGIAANGSDSVTFAVEPGSVIKAKAKAAKGSTAVPRISLYWNGATLSPSLEGDGKSSTKAHALVIEDNGQGGDVSVTVYNRGTATGDIDLQFKIKAPRPEKTKLDIRGQGGGEDSIISRKVNAAEGGRIEIDDPDDPLKGLEIAIPAGALPGDTKVTMSSTTAPSLQDPSGEQAAGPAIRLEPSGLTFSQPVDLWVPYDPDTLPVGSNPVNDLRVLKREDDGTTTVLVPLDVDTGNHVAHVQVNGFSTVLPYVPAGSPQLVGRTYWAFIFEMSFGTDVVNNDSRFREAYVEMGTVSFQGDDDFEGDVVVDTEGRTLSISHDDQGDAIFGGGTETIDGEVGSWSYENGGQTISVDFGDEENDEFAVSRSGNLLLGGVEGGQTIYPAVFTDLFLEKAATPPTPADLAGTWHWHHTGVASENGGGGPANHELFQGDGTLTVNANGTFKLSVKEKFLGAFDGLSKESFTESGTFSVVGQEGGIFAGSLLFLTGGNDPIEIRMLPSADGELMVGTDRFHPGQEFLWIYCVRQASGLTTADLDGDFRSIDVEMEIDEYQHPDTSAPIPDFVLANSRNTLTFDGSSMFDLLELQSNDIVRDPSQEGSGVRIDVYSGFTETQAFNLASNGAVDFTITEDGETERFVGAVSPSADFFVVLSDPTGNSDIFAFFMGILLPPEQQQQF